MRKSRIRSAEKPQTEQADQDQIDRDDDVQKARNDENQNTGNECDDRLQMRNTDGNDLLPFLAGNAIENGEKAGRFHFMTSQKRCEVLCARASRLSLDL